MFKYVEIDYVFSKYIHHLSLIWLLSYKYYYWILTIFHIKIKMQKQKKSEVWAKEKTWISNLDFSMATQSRGLEKSEKLVHRWGRGQLVEGLKWSAYGITH